MHPHLPRQSSDVTLVDTDDRPLGEEAPLKADSRRTPVPRVQLAALCALRVVEPVAFTHIFPYVNEMLERIGAVRDPAHVGFYSGLVESIFALAQLCSIYQWAQLSDIVGRRPILFAGALGLALSSLCFGLSTSLAGVLVARCMAGLFSGTVAVVHSVLGEITDSTNQATAFPIYGLFWPLGAIIGPLMGGALADPAAKFPRVFGGALWRAYPYLLPGCVAAGIALFGVVLAYFFLDETLPPRARRPAPASYGTFRTSTHSADEALQEKPKPERSLRALLSCPTLRSLCLSGFALSFVGSAFDALFVLFCFSPLSAGGLAFSSSQIGLALALAGTSSALLQLLLMPSLLARYSPLMLYTRAMRCWPPAFALLPLVHWLAARHAPAWAVWAGLVGSLSCSRAACLAYAVHMLLVRSAALPSASSGAGSRRSGSGIAGEGEGGEGEGNRLAKANGLAQLAQCAARAGAPAVGGALFAASGGGYAWAGAMVAVSVGACWVRVEGVEEGMAGGGVLVVGCE